jgi:hypothetical protein
MYTLRVRNDVVKMKAGIRPAFLAPPLITLPYFYLDPAWYEAIIFQRWRSDGWMIVIVGTCELEFELEDLAVPRLLSPAINQFEQPVVCPNTRSYFLVTLTRSGGAAPSLYFRTASAKSPFCVSEPPGLRPG